LPLYSYDYDADFPPEGRALKDAIEDSYGILFVSPEYNRSIPGALKNAIDWGSRPWGANSFARKPTGIIGASPGSIGTAVMQSSMAVLSFLDAPQLNAPEAYVKFNPEAFGDDGKVKDESTAAFLRHYMEEYGAFVERVLAANAAPRTGPRKALPLTAACRLAGRNVGSAGIRMPAEPPFPDTGFPAPVRVSGCYAALASRSSAIAWATMAALSAPRTSM